MTDKAAKSVTPLTSLERAARACGPECVKIKPAPEAYPLMSSKDALHVT